MATVLLVRHGRTTANVDGVLAGWTAGIGLDETGRAQVKGFAERLAVLPLAAVVTSPLQRCLETTAGLLDVPVVKPSARPAPVTDDRLGECHYGSWTGRSLKELVKDPLWRVIQVHPSGVTFPGDGAESMLAMQSRAVAAVREHDVAVTREHGPDALWLAVSHGDVIKSVLADALGMHLDAFQRIVVDPCSVSVIRYTSMRPFVLRVNDTGSGLQDLVPPPRRRRRRARGSDSDAVVGGPAGVTGSVPARRPPSRRDDQPVTP